MSNKQTIRKFIDTWATLDPEKLADFFTEDGVYHKMVSRKIYIERACGLTRHRTSSWS